MNLAGAVVVYNKSLEVLETINNYIDELDILYVVDNSDHPNTKLYSKLKENDKIVLSETSGNSGIATALNLAARKAQNDGYSWLLLMDQDSYFDKEELKKYKKRISEDSDSIIAVYAPNTGGGVFLQ